MLCSPVDNFKTIEYDDCHWFALFATNNRDTRKERVSERDKKVVQTFCLLIKNSLIGYFQKLQFEYTQYHVLMQKYFSKYLLKRVV